MEQALTQGESILQDLQEAGEPAAEGKGMEAATKLYECKAGIAMATDTACFFLRQKIEDLIKEVQLNSSRLPVAEGKDLVTSVGEWEKEFQAQRAALENSMVQLKFFPKEPPPAMKDAWMAREWWLRRPSLERLRFRLQDLLKGELDTARTLCAEPILNQYGQWNHTEGVILIAQCKEGLLQKCQLDKQGNRWSNKLSILSQEMAKGGASLRLVWMSDLEADLDGEDKVNVKDLLRTVFNNAEGIWIPKQVVNGHSVVQVYLQRENDLPPPNLSYMGSGNG